MDTWVKKSLALDDEFNYTEYPMENNPIIFDISAFTHQNKEVSPIVRDYASVSTFQSRYTTTSETAAIHLDEEMEETDMGSPDNNTTSSANHVTVDTINISNQEMEVSGISDTDSRFSLLQNQINTITSNFTVALE